MVRVLIADDQEVIRRGFRLFLKTAHDIEVIGDAPDGPQAVKMAHELHADVVLMDVRMPGGDGLEATRTLAGPGVIDPIPVIVVTAFDLDEYIFGALDAGASGFLLKDAGPSVLVEAIRAAARGDAMVSPAVTPRIIAEFARRQTDESSDTGDRAADVAAAALTTRELDIIRALARGMNNAEIARRLHLEPSTVKTHLTRINAKIGTRDRLQIAVWAFDHDLAQGDHLVP